MKFKMGGSGIHIKPENKGKFTATKKATGKSTEELTHSKNPVTKKRAIFAQNAAKWKHADGSEKLNLNKETTPDSTAYYGKQMEKFMKKRSSVSIDKAPPYDGKVNKAMSDMYRQGKKGKPGFDENGHPITKKMCGSKGMKYADGTDGTKPVIRTKDVGKVQAYNDSLNAYNNYQSIANDKSLDNRRYGYAFTKKLNKEELTKDFADSGREDPTKTYALKGNKPIGAIKKYNPTPDEILKDPSLRKYGIGSEQYIMEYAKPQQPYEQEKLPGGSGKAAQYPNMKKQSNTRKNTSSRMVNGKKVSGIANTFKEGTKAIKFKGKEMMKRADGSTSQRGLWDNIRANKGSGKKPTAEMLKQEKKIKAGK